MAELYPMELRPVFKDYIWGGNSLGAMFGKGEPGQRIAESWELAANEAGTCTVVNGAYAGLGLDEVAARLGKGRLPVLIKLIDAAKDLSVQVHPDAEYERKHPGVHAKTEMWHVLHAEPGAKLVYGFKRPTSAEEVAEALRRGTVEELLNYVEARAGDTFFIPAGLVHAIGAGLVIAEVQQNSDTTFRLYDYGRLQDGKPRELHIEQALEACRYGVEGPAERLYWPDCSKCEFTLTNLCKFEHISVEIFDVFGNMSAVFHNGPRSLLCLSGEAEIIHNEKGYIAHPGSSWLLPEGMGKVQFKGKCTFLLTDFTWV